MKTAFLFCTTLLPLAASAQKLQATAPPKTYHVGSEKAPLYASAADTAGKPRFTVPPGWEVSVVGEFSSRWAIVKREGYLYLTPAKSLESYTISSILSSSEKRFQELESKYQEEHKIRVAALKVLDDKNGFRTYRFGEDVAAYPNLKQQTFKGRKLQYIDPNENMRIGEADLKSITYFFYKGKLSSVLIETDGLVNSTRVKEALETQYGTGAKPNNFIDSYHWYGDKVSLTYKQNPITSDATIIFSNRALIAQEIADDKEVAKKAASDL